MGGKGHRRREKNFRAAHGGDSRLPPPPNPKELEAVPSKLRRLMQLMTAASTEPGSMGSFKPEGSEKNKKPKAKDAHSTSPLVGTSEKVLLNTSANEADTDTNFNVEDVRKKKKRKHKTVKDLRFQELDQAISQSRKRKRKEYLEAKKKHKKEKADDSPRFPGREEIKFGEVIDAPPKLSVPKGLKNPLDASRERLRLQAIENYRNRRGWDSRPGIQLPTGNL